jgi:pimeloyl-ACP methyl ester carboxylesterase
MGCYFALSLGARYPDRIVGVVCSNLYYFQNAAREKALQDQSARIDGQPIVDTWEIQDDGSHVNGIWAARSGWLSPELNTRATLDNLNYNVKRQTRYRQGIHIQDGGAFPLEETCQKVNCPVLCINGAGATSFFDMIGMEMTKQFEEAMTFFPHQPEQVVLDPPGSSINMLNENAKEWLNKVLEFAVKLD